MDAARKKFYITTSIAYVNAAPHLGFALESVQADAIARYHRLAGDDVFFLTGVDEHGAKISRAAAEAGQTPEEFAAFNSQKFRELKDILFLSWDDFIRTSDKERHWPQVIDLWRRLTHSGDLYRKHYRGLYCVGHEAFVTEKDLIDGRCRDHGRSPELVEEENYFFRLSRYASEVASKIRNRELMIVPESRANEILTFIGQGIDDVSFSRPRQDLSWGIPVPDDPTQTIYVWCDALANYLYPPGRWPADLHCIGKDILRFHALYWPAMLLSAGLPLPRRIFVHGFITVDGQKMSKSLGNVIDPVQLAAAYGADALRYYLLREISPTEDGDFSYRRFSERYAADLANGLGNFTARILTLGARLAGKKFNFQSDVDETVLGKIDQAKDDYRGKMTEYRFHEALAVIWRLIAFGDWYLNDRRPWETSTERNGLRPSISDQAIFDMVLLLECAAKLLRPFLPVTAEKILDGVRWHEGMVTVEKKGVLFPRIK